MEEQQRKNLQRLEFDKVREALAAHAETDSGREQARSITPTSDASEARRRLRETAEARALLRTKGHLSLAGVRDVRTTVRRAALGGTLEPSELLDVRGTLAVARALHTMVLGQESDLPALSAIVREMAPQQGLEQDIERAISPQGQVKDDASPLLSRLRKDVRGAHAQLCDRLGEIVSSPLGQKVLQEPLITSREERLVLPVKTEHRNQLPGLVHDISDSGATVFIEPLEAVELGNAWREMRIAERREVERVLGELSAAVGDRAPDIERTVERLAHVDLALAKARYANALQATEPEIVGEGEPYLRLRDARHPLLKGRVVPVSVDIGQGYTALLVTGPNTGGKTVALKTVGLLTVMAMAGLHIPAGDESVVYAFDSVYADIGDEQSIEQSLSTFSSHMGNIVHVLRDATSRSLVLLDEMGAGTDPLEGSALARAVLSELVRRRTLTLATTHHGELKAFAHVTPGMKNASVDFDPETLAPTYKLTIGLPGSSNALAIAERLGLERRLLDEARGFISPGQLEVDSLLTQIRRERDTLVAERRAAESARMDAERQRQELAAERERLEDRKADILEEAGREVRGRAEEMDKRLDRAARALDDVAAEREASHTVARDALKETVKKASAEVKAVRREVAGPAWSPPEPSRRPSTEGGPLRRGDTVRVRGLSQRAEVLSDVDAEGKVEVQAGALKLRVPVRDVVGRDEPSVRPAAVRVPSPPPGEGVGPELMLHGMRVEPALAKLDQYLNDAALTHLSRVVVVHGKGTGALRQAVREYLKGHPLVTAYASAPPESGGDGATVVELAG
ncbi:MAG: endonuclease MutS2 [Dehalococcoidia bacterium]|nr:endonuclease MutS2 [Dehalococcoidia bacterium]